MTDGQATFDESLETARESRWRERGASLVEYALLIALIVVVCIGAVTFFGSANSDSMSKSATSVLTAN